MSPCEQLSLREIRVATMVWEGKTNPQIAADLGSTEQVIKNQLRGIFDKLEPARTGTLCRVSWRYQVARVHQRRRSQRSDHVFSCTSRGTYGVTLKRRWGHNFKTATDLRGFSRIHTDQDPKDLKPFRF